MSVNVGTLEIQLRAQIANLQTDLGRANQMLVNTQQTMTQGFRQASEQSRAHLLLLEDAIGVRLPREMNRMISGIPAVAAAVNTAFATVGIVAFASIIAERVIPSVEKFIHFLNDSSDAAHKTADELHKTVVEVNKLTEANYEASLSPSAVAARHITLTAEQAREASAQIDRLSEHLRDLLSQREQVGHGEAAASGGLVAVYNEQSEAVKKLEAERDQLSKQLQAYYSNQLKNVQDLTTAEKKESEDALAAMEKRIEAQRRLSAEQFTAVQIARKAFDALQLASVGNVIGGASDLQSQRQGPTYASTFGTRLDVQNIETLRQAADVYNTTRTAAEMYRQTLADLNELLDKGVISQSTFGRAVEQAKSALDADTIAMHRFGEESGRALEQGVLMSESWSQVLRKLLIDVINLIAKMTILKSLDTEAGGVTGFFGNLLTGFFGGGHAAGGPVTAGTSYMVGESGPELFTPTGSGNIIPNSRLGGITNIIDARGADAGVEYRIQRALAQVEQRAVQRAVVTMKDLNART